MKTSQKLLQLTMALALVAGLLGPAAFAWQQTPSKTQPILLEMAAEAPGDPVQVIVQKADESDQAERRVAALGGLVTRELPLINAFVAELPASAATRLGRETAVKWVSLDAPMVDTNCGECVDVSALASTYVETIKADILWNEAPYLQGQNVTVAVIDSGIAAHFDFNEEPRLFSPPRFLTMESFVDGVENYDLYGHGTHIAGTIGGNGFMSAGMYIGVAPKVDLISLKVTQDDGSGYTSDVVAGMQWVFEHKDEYNIRVVNLSLNSSVPESYRTNPLSVAVELLWFNGVVVVVSSGNNGDNVEDKGILYPPANDPFVITVGASDDLGTSDPRDDVLADYTSFGFTSDGFLKPEIVAPGTNIIAPRPIAFSFLSLAHPDHKVAGANPERENYFRMSGTSMAAAVVSGSVALLLQDEPGLTPDQVKYRLTKVSDTITSADKAFTFPYLDIHSAVHGNTTEAANQDNIVPTELLAQMALLAYWANQNGEETIDWAAVNWNSVNWNSVNWNSVNWNSVNWNAVNWNAVNWNSVNWNAVNWNSVNWNSVNWNSVNWNSVNWNSVNWNSVSWN